MSDMNKLPGLKHRDLKPCIFCGKGMMHSGAITFYRVKVERCIVDVREVKRAAGLEQMMGGHALLANVMGPDADLAKVMPGLGECLVCDDCSVRRGSPVAAIAEIISDRETPAEAAAE